MLWVSNQSYVDRTVDVTIDGTAIIDRVFDVGNQHNFVEHPPQERPGFHFVIQDDPLGFALTAAEPATLVRSVTKRSLLQDHGE
jgi:hypothetical protein